MSIPPKIQTTIEHVDAMRKTIDPLRRSIFKRFPTIFTLLVTFGVTATFFAVERILAATPFFNEHPWYTLALGLFILVATGKLYAKLG